MEGDGLRIRTNGGGSWYGDEASLSGPRSPVVRHETGSDLLVRDQEGRRQGKWILRKAFEEVLPHEVIWRVKTPIEFGTGTTVFPRIFDASISDGEFDRKVSRYLEEDKVALRDKEQLFYYEIYRSIFGIPGGDESQGRTCPKCRSNLRPEASYCRTCGAFPI